MSIEVAMVAAVASRCRLEGAYVTILIKIVIGCFFFQSVYRAGRKADARCGSLAVWEDGRGRRRRSGAGKLPGHNTPRDARRQATPGYSHASKCE